MSFAKSLAMSYLYTHTHTPSLIHTQASISHPHKCSPFCRSSVDLNCPFFSLESSIVMSYIIKSSITKFIRVKFTLFSQLSITSVPLSPPYLHPLIPSPLQCPPPEMKQIRVAGLALQAVMFS